MFKLTASYEGFVTQFTLLFASLYDLRTKCDLIYETSFKKHLAWFMVERRSMFTRGRRGRRV